MLDHLSSSPLRWKVKSNSSSVFRGRESGGLDPVLPAVAVARGDLGSEQRPRSELLIAPGLLPARSARPGSARAAAGAFNARNRCASSAVRRSCRISCVIDATTAGCSTSISWRWRRRSRCRSSWLWCSGSTIVWQPGEDPLVPGGQLARVEHDRGDLASVRRGPRHGGRRTPGRASSRCDRPGSTAAAAPSITVRRSVSVHHPPAAAASLALLRQTLGRDARIVRCERPLTFSVQRSSWSWKSRSFAKTRRGSKFDRMKPVLSAPTAPSPAHRLRRG